MRDNGEQDETVLLADYAYTRPSNCAAMSNFLLFVSAVGVEGGIDVYTIRNALRTRAETISPPDISMLCSKRLFSPVEVCASGRNIAVMVKQSERKQGSFKRGTSSGERCFNVYALRTFSLGNLHQQLVDLGVDYRLSNWPVNLK